jgi:hypothetical protein
MVVVTGDVPVSSSVILQDYRLQDVGGIFGFVGGGFEDFE